MPRPSSIAVWLLFVGLLLAGFTLAQIPSPQSFHFALLGDRTGEAEPGVYEHIWREMAAEDPAFVVSVGDSIEGLRDASVDAEWQQVEQTLLPYSRFPLYLVPGNHDIWSEPSEQAFRKYAGHAPHYSFDYQQAHFTILDNSRTDQLSASEMTFLEADLALHQSQPVKFIVTHRPSWVLQAALGSSRFALHQLAKKYGVRYVIAGHLHKLLHVDIDGVTYLSMESSGGHLRASGKYEDGWFFGHTRVDVHGNDVQFKVEETGEPHGHGRTTPLLKWGAAGLVDLPTP